MITRNILEAQLGIRWPKYADDTERILPHRHRHRKRTGLRGNAVVKKLAAIQDEF
jgi:hypothetical protein